MDEVAEEQGQDKYEQVEVAPGLSLLVKVPGAVCVCLCTCVNAREAHSPPARAYSSAVSLSRHCAHLLQMCAPQPNPRTKHAPFYSLQKTQEDESAEPSGAAAANETKPADIEALRQRLAKLQGR